MATEFDMSGKVAMVTGASSGFGVHFAKILAARGAKVVVAARRIDRLDARCTCGCIADCGQCSLFLSWC